jgi:excisionase family DNA binding protein
MSYQHEPIHLSVKDACSRHNLSRSALYILIGQGKITAIKNGRRTLINVPSLDSHFASLPPAVIKAPAPITTIPTEPPPITKPSPVSDIDAAL